MLRRLLILGLAATAMLWGFTGCEMEPDEHEDDAHAFAWPTSAPAAQGLDADLLDEMGSAAKQGHVVDALLVIRHGVLVWEDYYQGMSETTRHSVHSVTKSVLATLIGMAIDAGLIEGADVKVMDLYPEYWAHVRDQRWGDMTLQHLLDMTGGIPAVPAQNNTAYDAVADLLQILLVNDPGQAFIYSGYGSHLLSVILSTVSQGRTAASYARTYLCPPLGIELPFWMSDNYRYSSGSSGIEITPRDLARIGLLYLNGGEIDGQRVLSADWVNEVVNMPLGQGSWGDLKNLAYHNLWWGGTLGGHRTFQAIGFGGQLIIGFPDFDLLVVSMCETPNSDAGSESHYDIVYQLIQQYVIPAINE